MPDGNKVAAVTFDPQRIDRELGLAQVLLINTARVFLHDLRRKQEAAGFRKRMDTFPTIATEPDTKSIFVLFDSCRDPQLVPRRPPLCGAYNSGWVHSPGNAMDDSCRDHRPLVRVNYLGR